MPGTIQVSVVGLRDLPKQEASASPFTLKIAMGKREYQSMGQGDCSINVDGCSPVVSIRENLIVAIHDVGGNEIFQTEFRTILVVEKGLVEDSYPLKSGGYVHMKLQFLLSQEEHMRVREMRESAMKRKRGEQLQSETKGFDSDSSASSGTTSVQVSEQRSESSTEKDGDQLIEVRTENLKIQSPVDGVNKWHISSEVGLDPKSECSTSLVSGSATEHGYPYSAEPKEYQNRSNVRKMVTVFESSLFQGPDPHFGPGMKSSLCKIDVEGSLKRVPSNESDIDKLRAPQTISKSFSAGMLSDVNSQQNPMLFQSAFLKKQAEIEHVGPAKKWEAMGKCKDYFEPKNDEKLKNQDSVEPIAIKETMHTPKSECTEHVKERDGPVSSVSEKGPSAMSLKRDFKAPEEIVDLAVISKDSKLSDIHTVSGASDAMASSRSEVVPGSKHNPADEGSLSGDRTDDGNEQSVTENLPLPKNIKLEAVHIKEKEKEECASVKEIQLSRKILDESARIDQPGSLNTYQQGSLLSAATKESEDECTRSSDKQILSATPNETVNFLTDFDNDGCSFGNHDVWTTRRLCFTTGTRQLRDLVDCGTNCAGTHPIEKNPSIGSADQKPDNDAALHMNKNGKISCTSVKPNDENVGITKSNGSLIEQGVKIAIVLVACGTLLFNTRQRKTK